MPITLNQIIEEVRSWPEDRVNELLDRLNETVRPVEPEVEAAWKQETRKRIVEIESGRVRGVPGDEVSERIRKLVGR